MKGKQGEKIAILRSLARASCGRDEGVKKMEKREGCCTGKKKTVAGKTHEVQGQ